MKLKRRPLQRVIGERRYRKLFLIAAEGGKTEPQYFGVFNDQQSVIRVTCFKGKHSSPIDVMKQMKERLKEEKLLPSDEAWLVVDKDNWTDEQLHQLFEWSCAKGNYGFALSNPKFEYWLLLHFEDGNGITSSRVCSERLKRHLPEYGKGINASTFTQDKIEAAIARAKLRDSPRCLDWPRTFGCTTVYRLVENILSARS
ncbi:MAG: RloB family protein [Armatimonadetes bacterium]|nr:RloB family protein [Armatimonadota bacterium]